MAVQSNLDGVGPNNSSPHELRIPEIAQVGTTKVDLVVTVVDGDISGASDHSGKKYKSFRAESCQNGVGECKNGGGAYVSKTEPGPYPVANNQAVTDVWGVGNSPCWIVLPWHTKTNTKFNW